MDALRGMFPAWDAQLLADVLEAHGGDLEASVDALLAMDAAQEQAQPPPAPVQRSPKRQIRASPTTSPTGQRRRVKLPDDFLRLPSDETRPLSDQEQLDAELARMMQDEIFRDEVLSSEEFSSHFHERSRRNEAYPPEKTATEIATETYNAMSEKLSSMSEVMKNKMHEMYMRFQMRNDAPANRDVKSQRPLMEDDSESSSDEEVDDTREMRRRNVDQRRSQGSPRRWSPTSVTRRSGAGAFSKKDD